MLGSALGEPARKTDRLETESMNPALHLLRMLMKPATPDCPAHRKPMHPCRFFVKDGSSALSKTDGFACFEYGCSIHYVERCFFTLEPDGEPVPYQARAKRAATASAGRWKSNNA
jgi:hypothetical protein